MAVKIVPAYQTIPDNMTLDQLEKFVEIMEQGIKDVQAAYIDIKDNTE